MQNILSKPKRTVKAQLVIPIDQNKLQSYTAYCIHHSDAMGPCIGGLQLHPDVTLDQMRWCVQLPLHVPFHVTFFLQKCSFHMYSVQDIC